MEIKALRAIHSFGGLKSTKISTFSEKKYRLSFIIDKSNLMKPLRNSSTPNDQKLILLFLNLRHHSVSLSLQRGGDKIYSSIDSAVQDAVRIGFKVIEVEIT